jgi:hypothetical protein
MTRNSTEYGKRCTRQRRISFSVFAPQSGGLLDDLVHPNPGKYPGQRVFVVSINGYAWLVPYVEPETEFFLKTAIPSRKATRRYIRRHP